MGTPRHPILDVQLVQFIYFCFLGPILWHVEDPRLRVKSKLQLPAYTTATATRDLSGVCNLCHSSWQCWILNPLSKARDQTHNLMVPSRICFHCAMTGTPQIVVLSQSVHHACCQNPGAPLYPFPSCLAPAKVTAVKSSTV